MEYDCYCSDCFDPRWVGEAFDQAYATRPPRDGESFWQFKDRMDAILQRIVNRENSNT